jgi:hypothetical protein
MDSIQPCLEILFETNQNKSNTHFLCEIFSFFDFNSFRVFKNDFLNRLSLNGQYLQKSDALVYTRPVNLPHIGNWKCIKFVLQRFFFNKTQGLTFFSRNLCGEGGYVGLGTLRI